MTRTFNSCYGESHFRATHSTAMHSPATMSWRRSVPGPASLDLMGMTDPRTLHPLGPKERAAGRKCGPIHSYADGSDTQSASTSSSRHSRQQSVQFNPLSTGSSDSEVPRNIDDEDRCPSLNMPGAFPMKEDDDVHDKYPEIQFTDVLQVIVMQRSSSFISLRGYEADEDDRSSYSYEKDDSEAMPAEYNVVESAPLPPPPKLMRCSICFDDHEEDSMVSVEPCHHRFCSHCLRAHIDAKLQGRQYPVVCPLCSSDRSPDPSTLSAAFMQTIGMSEKSKIIFNQLQLDRYSVFVHCSRCDRETFVDRQEYDKATIVICPFPGCGHSWCKQCSTVVNPRNPSHPCGAKAGAKALQRLMEKQGWTYCPGCRTPTSKSEGCNHMTCVTPGCNTHFCYLCGKSIARTTNQREIGHAILMHYADCSAPRSNRRNRLVRLVTPTRLRQLFDINIRNPFRRRS